MARPCTTASYVERVAGPIAREMAPNTIRPYMSGVRMWMPEDRRPGMAKARGMLAEHRKEWGKRNRVRKAAATTEPMLHVMVDTCDSPSPAGLRDRCVVLVGRSALNRRIELADLDTDDIEVEDDGVDLGSPTRRPAGREGARAPSSWPPPHLPATPRSQPYGTG
ncbi:hypothetical protein ACIA8F_35015 [Streptomyces sp. NPDC051563]|uniref:hypothetical protein n=1 Tax=Streptomyces sp. NPDC051563 TaxID=3365659 RepID=UPI0037AE46E7